jgi:hypothetical protein
MQAGRNLLEYTASHPSHRRENLTSQCFVLRNLETVFSQDICNDIFKKRIQESIVSSLHTHSFPRTIQPFLLPSRPLEGRPRANICHQHLARLEMWADETRHLLISSIALRSKKDVSSAPSSDTCRKQFISVHCNNSILIRDGFPQGLFH